MEKKLEKLLIDSIEEKKSPRGIYIAISGNTGAGKSTLAQELEYRIQKNYPKTLAVNERNIHHPLLKLMFSKPKEYSFIVQLNFLLQRHGLIYRLLNLGYSIIVERSHFDDEIFVRNHFNKGHIDEESYRSYSILFNVLQKKLPDPDLHIFLDISAEDSMSRLEHSENMNQRPKEFPNDNIKKEVTIQQKKCI